MVKTIQSNTNSCTNHLAECKYEYLQKNGNRIKEHKQQLPCNSVSIMLYGDTGQKFK